eukprot:1822727-Prymnesium_polylepis.1
MAQAPRRGGGASGLQRYLERRAILTRAFPNMAFELLEQSYDNGRVVTSWEWVATNTGPYHANIDG